MGCADVPHRVPLAAELVFLGHRVSHLIERRLARHGYNHTQAVIIMTLARHPGRMAQDLAGPVRVEPPSVTRALQTLERRGLVDRTPHPTDGRASLFHLTATGREVAVVLARLMEETSGELEQCISPEELAALRMALGSLIARVEELRGVAT